MRTIPVDLAVQRELFTIAEVAAILSLSERTVESLVARGHLRSAVAPGTDRARRISRTMIAEYIECFDSQNPPRGNRKRR
jgi:excisionase family DNA binding protein